jgi:RNA recognition motif-containing protein
VGDLDLSVTEDYLKDFFSKYYNSVIGVKVIIDPVNKNSKGYGFVKFAEQSEASRALTEMNGKVINGKAIKTK